jgi:hypothetical protein
MWMGQRRRGPSLTLQPLPCGDDAVSEVAVKHFHCDALDSRLVLTIIESPRSTGCQLARTRQDTDPLPSLPPSGVRRRSPDTASGRRRATDRGLSGPRNRASTLEPASFGRCRIGSSRPLAGVRPHVGLPLAGLRIQRRQIANQLLPLADREVHAGRTVLHRDRRGIRVQSVKSRGVRQHAFGRLNVNWNPISALWQVIEDELTVGVRDRLAEDGRAGGGNTHLLQPLIEFRIGRKLSSPGSRNSTTSP